MAWTAEQDANPFYTGIRVAYAPAGESFGASHLIGIDPAGTGPMFPHVCFDRSGGAIAVWCTQDGRMRYATRPARG